MSADEEASEDMCHREEVAIQHMVRSEEGWGCDLNLCLSSQINPFLLLLPLLSICACLCASACAMHRRANNFFHLNVSAWLKHTVVIVSTKRVAAQAIIKIRGLPFWGDEEESTPRREEYIGSLKALQTC